MSSEVKADLETRQGNLSSQEQIEITGAEKNIGESPIRKTESQNQGAGSRIPSEKKTSANAEEPTAMCSSGFYDSQECPLGVENFQEKSGSSDSDDSNPESLVIDVDHAIQDFDMNQLLPKKRYACNYCEKSFNQKAGLVQHMRVHTGARPYICSLCKMCFSQKGNLNQHMRRHTGELPYSCSYCDKRYPSNTSLTAHLKTHIGGKSYPCTYCSQIFSLKTNLDQHLRRHTGVKPYSCSKCEKSFTQKGTLNKHMKAHTEAVTFYCPSCKSSFRRRLHVGLLNMSKSLKPYTCSYCNKNFGFKENLYQHMISHTGVDPSSCNHCKNAFNV